MTKVRIDGKELEFTGILLEFLLSSDIDPDSYLFLCNGRPIPVDSEPSDDVEAIRVASGG